MIISYNSIKSKIYIAYLKLIRNQWEGFKFRKRLDLPNTAVLNKNSYHYLGLVAIFRGEDEYLLEWIEFNRMMGIDHFILYDNGLEKNSKVLLKPYIEKEIITHIPFPDIPGLRDGRHANTLSIQQLAYADFIIRFRHNFKYILQLDIDEFLFPKKHSTIKKYLQTFDDDELGRLEINWTNFGNSGHIKKPSGLVIENFIKSSKKIVPHTVKSISNTRYLSRKFVYTNVHRFSHRLSFKDIFTKIFFGYPIIIRGKIANDLFQLNHYITKSKEEYLRKLKINKRGYMVGKETIENFIKLNSYCNQIEDKTIFRFLQKLKDKANSN